MLIDRGDLVLIADNQGVRDIYSADGNSIDKSTPLVVLVNKGTASASEVGSWERVQWRVGCGSAECCVGDRAWHGISRAPLSFSFHCKSLQCCMLGGTTRLRCAATGVHHVFVSAM